MEQVKQKKQFMDGFNSFVLFMLTLSAIKWGIYGLMELGAML